MAATVDWGQKEITVYQADLTHLSGDSYELDTEAFKIELRELEASEAGQVHPDILNHNTSVTLDGIDYARIIEIINGYTITFEEKASPYKVFLKGSNNNILTVTNLGTVQVAPNNSAGLINITEVQHDVFAGYVWVDQANGTAGTTYPAATPLSPVDNFTDAVAVAASRGLDAIKVIGNATLGSGDNVAGYRVVGQNAALSTITINTAANVTNCEFTSATISNSVLDGNNLIKECAVSNLTYVEGILYNCTLSDNIQIASASDTYLIDCKSGCVGLGASDLPKIDLSGGETHLAIRNWSGPIKVISSTNAATTACIDVTSGATVIIDSTVTAGEITVRGSAKIIHTQTGTESIVHDTTEAGVWAQSDALTTGKFLALN